jgi:predicted dienelactone hydrolase
VKNKTKGFITLVFTLFILKATSQNEFIYGDALPDAPELAKRGPHKVGVKSLEFVHKNQVDIINSKDGVDAFYDRDLKVEVWYPADMADENPVILYDEVMGTANDEKRPLIPFQFKGRASRDAKLKSSAKKYPLIVVSHGYVGSRFLMTYLTENLASKGYIVAAIDHKESTFRDANAFHSTLLNRAQDIHFVVNEMTKLPFTSKVMDRENIGIIGYSMGGYGSLNVAGAGYSAGLAKFFGSMSGGSKAIDVLTTGNEKYEAAFDSRIKAVVAFAPWGMARGIWDSEGLKGLKIPTFFVAGSQDDISGYEKGIKAIYEGATNVERYMLTYGNARHNVAPNPPPAESLAEGLPFDEYYRYAEPSWDERRINNINQHFVTAFMDTKLKQKDHAKYLDLKPNSNDGTWEGFKDRSSTGLELLHAGVGE